MRERTRAARGIPTAAALEGHGGREVLRDAKRKSRLHLSEQPGRPRCRQRNGEPFLHAAWIGAVAPQPGETLTQIGAGTGYYSAILSMLVRPGGRVYAFEIEEKLAAAARTNLASFENVTVENGNGVLVPIEPSDVIYVNAGAVAPPAQWLRALRPRFVHFSASHT